jgi:hypothetical protein
MDPPPPPVTMNEILHTMNEILQTRQAFRTEMTTVNTELNQLRTRFGPPGFTPDPGPQHPFAHTSIKLDIPRFDGTEPLNWIFKIKQFFEFHRTPEDQRLSIASFYMEGDALTWFQWMFTNGQLHSWPAFLHALELRFAPSQFEDPKGTLFKLCQNTTVRDY